MSSDHIRTKLGINVVSGKSLDIWHMVIILLYDPEVKKP